MIISKIKNNIIDILLFSLLVAVLYVFLLKYFVIPIYLNSQTNTTQNNNVASVIYNNNNVKEFTPNPLIANLISKADIDVQTKTLCQNTNSDTYITLEVTNSTTIKCKVTSLSIASQLPRSTLNSPSKFILFIDSKTSKKELNLTPKEICSIRFRQFEYPIIDITTQYISKSNTIFGNNLNYDTICTVS